MRVCIAFGFTWLVRSGLACFQDKPLLYGCDPHKDQYEDICCKVPQKYAEHKGFADTLNVYATLQEMVDAGNDVVFYDSQCGLPLYVVPRGRPMTEFVEESQNHGWPSFRDAEFISENLKVEPGYNGEIVSKCGTHLGHNLPYANDPGNRHCINLMCIAGGNATTPMTTKLSITITATTTQLSTTTTTTVTSTTQPSSTTAITYEENLATGSPSFTSANHALPMASSAAAIIICFTQVFT
mmetsp:Transcript_135748/g.260702  ORF Transcript_135748/g.260702 Transcript_135748/m.260702 type:complete len:240 (+) Transcript_135748:79-798(+)